ncbi:T9SS type A sorting domain-containing protein [Hymenobacter terricola]|uniref:T9SS type A sorting domain-containing protein n=1 Tax=Hymenobacter terricola TaxID=2819236 RepID=UPI001B316525|nr:T9SS type A sorting domain-containing protein [Hymenobacter terricola]
MDPFTDVSIVIPAYFQGSTDNTTFSTATLVFTTDAAGNVPATTVYLRFAPTGGAGTTINKSVFAQGTAGGDPSLSTPSVKLRGDALAGSPIITVSPSSLSFGSQLVGTSSSAMSFVVNATSLGTTPITVTAPSGFLVSYSGSTYAATASITPAGGAVSNASVSVVFTPTATQNYVSTIALVSSTASASESVSGTGVPVTPTLIASPTSLAFGATTVGAATASQVFTVSGSNLQGNVTIAAPAGFQIRTGSSFFSSNPITLAPNNGALANTNIDVRFAPTQAGSYTVAVTVSTPNSSATLTRTVTVTGTANPSSGTPSLTATPTAVDFGSITSSGSSTTRNFEVSGSDLTADIVLTPSNSNVQIRNASAGGSFSSSPLTITQANGAVAAQVIEVRLVSLVAQGAFSQQISVTSNGATPADVAVTANNPSGATSDISVSNPDANNFTFVTRPNTVSASQRFLVAGTNLVQPLVVQAVGPNASYFQISTDNVNFFNSVSFTPNAQGNVTQRAVFVRFMPSTNAITVTSTIRNSSTPAPDFDVSVTGISEPTIRLDRAIGSFAENVVKNTVTAPVAVQLEGFLLNGSVELRFPDDTTDPTRNPLHTPLFEFSLDNGVTYMAQTSAQTLITPDANGNFSTKLLVRYAPVRVGNAAQELQFRNASFFSNTFFALTSGFGRTTGFSIAIEPTAQSTASIIRSADRTSATITFNLQNPPANKQYGDNRLVIASSTYNTTLPVSLFPVDKQNFNPGTTSSGGAYNFGTGTAIEASSNTYVVFSGANNSFTVTNLNPTLYYNFFGFEFNNDGVLNAENYLVPNNQPLNPLPVELTSFTAKRRDNAVAVNWATATEKNSAYFEVQRSLNGETFATVAHTPARGTSTQPTAYSALDSAAPAGMLYYRLRQVDLDGTSVYSPVVTVAGTGLSAKVLLYPNPAHGSVSFAAEAATPYRVLNQLGQSLLRGTTEAGTTTVALDQLPTGLYLLELQTATGRMVQKFEKE